MKILTILFVLILSSITAFACVELQDGKAYSNSTDVCNKVYFLDEGIIIHGDDVVFDCSSAVLRGNFFKNSGISIINSNNVTIKDCNVMHYSIGINVQNSRDVILMGNHLIKNKLGTKFFGSEDCFVYSADISLKSPVKIAGSKDNFIHYFNKKIKKHDFDNKFNKLLSVSEERKNLDFTPKFVYWISPFSNQSFSINPIGQWSEP